MRFKQYYFTEATIIDDWKNKVNSNPYLKASIEVLEILYKKFPGSASYLVGGVVRDLVMNIPFDDIDIATNININEIEKIFKTHNIGANKDFNIVVIDYKGYSIECAHFREDGEYSDHRRPDSVKSVSDFKSDAKRRDTTFNAMAIDKNGNILDYFNGIDDIKNKLVKMVGNPNDRFKEDSLRLLRVPRFASRLGFDISSETIEAIKSNAPEIKKVAAERIYKELWKMSEQLGEKFANAILMLKDLGLLQYILPEVLQTEQMPHSEIHHPEGFLNADGNVNVLGHTIEALKSYKGNNPLVNWSILLHDIGKNSNTYALSDHGTHSYHGHPHESVKLIDEIARRLTLPNEVRDAIKFACENHMKITDIPKMSNSSIAQLMKSPYFNILLDTSKADWMARGSLYKEEDWQKVLNKINKVKEITKGKNVIDSVKKVVSGNLIMKLRPEIKPSPMMGKIIDDTVNYIINNEIDLDDTETIEKYIMDWKG